MTADLQEVACVVVGADVKDGYAPDNAEHLVKRPSTGVSSTDLTLKVHTPCGRALSPVGHRWENSHQETTSESTPGHRSGNSYPGPRRPIGDDRLMTKISTISGTAPAVCPNCGQSAAAESVRAEGNIRTGDYRCNAGHIWSTRWLVAA